MTKEFSPSAVADAAISAPETNTDKISVVNDPFADGRQTARDRGVTLRVVVISLLLAALFGYAIPIVDYKFSNTFLGAAHLPAGAIAVLLFLLLVLNPILNLLSHRLTLSRNETLTIYITCLFSTLTPGRGGENFFVPNILASFYYATSENNWLSSLQPYIKPWLTPALTPDGQLNRDVVEGWYVGTNGVIPWASWIVPLVAWTSMILALHFMLGCLGVMLRAQWAEREALTFPLLRLPTDLTEDLDRNDKYAVVGRFFRNPAMWVGFGIAVFIEALNGLNLYFPDVPRVPLNINMAPVLSEAPWNQIGGIEVRVFPTVVGITYLLTSEVSLSLWFFYLFTKAQLIMAYYMGIMPSAIPDQFWTRGWAKGFIGYQQFGAYFAYVGLVLWIGREHFGHIVRRAFGRAAPSPSEKQEALSYPVAFWGFIASFAFVLLWTIAAGVNTLLALAMWLTYLVVALGLTRVVAEGGLMFVHTGWMTLGPLAFLLGGAGKMFSAASAAPASIISGSLMFEMRGFLLPSFVQSFKLAHDRKIAIKPLLALIAAVTVISFSVGVWMVIKLGYTEGGLQLQRWWIETGATQPARHTIGITRDIETNFLVNWLWFGIGGLLTYGIMMARSRLLWFPLHPIGVLMCVPFAMYSMWFSIFLGWLCKVLITRFGGADTYRKMTPTFLGLALGHIVMVVLWVIIDAWQGRTAHALLPF
ncbi:MAG TPA: DUF6785 family protein [Abditibacteriaceae bacterium]|jgi:hypothetical protein